MIYQEIHIENFLIFFHLLFLFISFSSQLFLQNHAFKIVDCLNVWILVQQKYLPVGYV